METGLISPNTSKLPPLTREQVEQVTKFIKNCDYSSFINWDNICCDDDAADEAVIGVAKCFENSYGFGVE